VRLGIAHYSVLFKDTLFGFCFVGAEQKYLQTLVIYSGFESSLQRIPGQKHERNISNNISIQTLEKGYSLENRRTTVQTIPSHDLSQF